MRRQGKKGGGGHKIGKMGRRRLWMVPKGNHEKKDLMIFFSFYRGTSSHHQKRNRSCFGRFGL